MRKMMLGLLLGSLVLSAQAKPLPAADKDDAATNYVRTQMIEKVLNAIQNARFDINANDIVFEKKDKESKSEVQINDGTASTIVSFNSDILLDLIAPQQGGDAAQNEQLRKLFPKLQILSKNLSLGFEVTKTPDLFSVKSAFFSGLDRKTGQWTPGPLAIQVSNQLNKNLLAILLHSVKATATPRKGDPDMKDVEGSCVSDKLLYDFATNKNKMVRVDCHFSGYLSKDGYKIQLKYANK